MSEGFLRLIGIGTVMALMAVSIALVVTRDELSAERLNHALTRQERDDWKARAEAAATRAEALAGNARRCLEREAQAQADAAERAAIMDAARPRPRTETEKAKVVDDETRQRVADRLNRPL